VGGEGEEEEEQEAAGVARVVGTQEGQRVHPTVRQLRPATSSVQVQRNLSDMIHDAYSLSLRYCALLCISLAC
jgi:hypothetical protein